MDRYEFQLKINKVLNTIGNIVPRILKVILNAFSFIIYTIALIWLFLTSLITLGILYIGSGCAYLERRLRYVEDY